MVTIQEVTNPMVEINLNEFENESEISMFESASFSYEIVLHNVKITDLKITLGPTTIVTSKQSSGSFIIERYANQLTSGRYELTITVNTTSGSKSLADKVEAEQFQIWRTWYLNVDVDLPQKPVVTQTKENGVMKLSWTPYTKSNFGSYKVIINSSESFTNDPTQNFFYLDSYPGGFPISYQVEIGNSIGSVSSDKFYYDDQFILEGNFNFSDSMVQLQWNTAEFEGAFKGYAVSEISNNTSKIIAYIDNVEETTLNFKPSNLLFGLTLEYRVYIEPLAGSWVTTNGFKLSKIVENPTLTPAPLTMTFNSERNEIFGTTLNNQSLTQYNDQLNIIGQVVGSSSNYFVPLMGSKVYFTDNNVGIIQRDLTNGSEKSIDIESLTPWGIFTNPIVGVCSNNEIVAFGYLAHNASGNTMVNNIDIHNMQTEVRLFHLEITGSITNSLPSISSGGSYARLYGNAIGKVGATDIQLLYGHPHNFYAFRQDDESEFMTVENSTIYIHDSETGSVKRTIDFTGFFFRGYDPGSKHLLLAKVGEKSSQVVDIETGERKSLPMYTWSPQGLILINGFVVTPSGDYFKAIN